MNEVMKDVHRRIIIEEKQQQQHILVSCNEAVSLCSAFPLFVSLVKLTTLPIIQHFESNL